MRALLDAPALLCFEHLLGHPVELLQHDRLAAHAGHERNHQRTLLALHNRFGKVSAAAEIAFNIYTNSPPPTVTNPKLLENNLARMTAAYEATLTEAAEFVETKVATFLHFFEPQPTDGRFT